MFDWGLTISCVVSLLAGSYELYRTFRYYQWDKKAKENPMSPYLIYFGTFFGGVFLIVPIMFLSGVKTLQLGRKFYIPLGFVLIIVSIYMFRRGHEIALHLKKNESNIAVWQIYLISFVIMCTGIFNLFRRY